MLSEQQKGMFKLLDLNEGHEKVMRERHKQAREMGSAPKSFSAWLTHCVHAKWRRENSRVYVGD